MLLALIKPKKVSYPDEVQALAAYFFENPKAAHFYGDLCEKVGLQLSPKTLEKLVAIGWLFMTPTGYSNYYLWDEWEEAFLRKGSINPS